MKYSCRWLSLALVGLILFNTTGCIVTYGRFPKNKVNAPPYPKTLKQVTFHINGVGLASGHEAIVDAFRLRSPFEEAIYTEEKMSKGYFVSVEIRNVMPSIPALAFGYISVCFLTLTPAWTLTGGSDVTFRLYQNENLVKSATYQVRRKGFLWIVLLPFIWVNAMTYSEYDAFNAMVMQFFEDAKDQLNV